MDGDIFIRTEDANERLDFDDENFDTIVAVAVLQFLFDPYNFMEECYRLMRPGGTLIVQVPNVAFLPNRIRLFFGKRSLTTSSGIGWNSSLFYERLARETF